MKPTFLALSLLALCAPMHAAPTLVGWFRSSDVEPAGAEAQPYLWLGGAYFPGKGFRTDAQAKGFMYSGTRWQLFSLDGAGPRVTTNQLMPPDVPVGYNAPLRTPLSAKKFGGKEFVALSIASRNNAAKPLRVPRQQNLNQAIYRSAAAKLLSAKGLKLKRARLTQLMRVDLDGNGTEEVLMTAHSRDNYGRSPGEKAGDYAMTAIRFVETGSGRPKSAPLDLAFSTKNAEFSAPGYSAILACADVDGDGKLEIITSTGYYEGWGIEVWKFDGKSVKRVLTAGWGV